MQSSDHWIFLNTSFCILHSSKPQPNLPNPTVSGLFVSLYSAVERLLLYQDQTGPAHSAAACRCILLHELCPALHTLLEDGLKVGTLAPILEFFNFDIGVQYIDDLMIYLHCIWRHNCIIWTSKHGFSNQTTHQWKFCGSVEKSPEGTLFKYLRVSKIFSLSLNI